MTPASHRATKRRWLLAGGLMILGCWALHGAWIAPLRESERIAAQRIEELSGKLESAHAAIEEVRTLEQRAASARAELDRWRRERPAASAMLWFPERIREHFRRAGFAEAVTRLNTTRAEAKLPRFQRSFWAMELPLRAQPGEIGKVLLAAAELEQAEPHVRVLDFAIRRGAGDTHQLTAVLNVSTLARE